LGGPTRSIKTPVSIAIRVIEVLNPLSPHHDHHHEKVTTHRGGDERIRFPMVKTLC